MPEFFNRLGKTVNENLDECYTDVEVAHKLNKPYTEILRMANLGQLPVKFVDDKRKFPKQAIDHLASTNAPTRKAETKPHKISEHPQEALSPVKDIRETELQEAARTLNKTINQVRQMVDAGDLVKDSASGLLVSPEEMSSYPQAKGSKAEQQKYFTAEEAAEYLDVPLSSIHKKIRNKELPVQNGKIPARSVLNLYDDSKLGQKTPSEADRTPFVVPLTMRVFARILAARLPSPRTLPG